MGIVSLIPAVAVAQTGGFSGVVTRSGQPFPGVQVRVYNGSAQLLTSVTTDSSGAYGIGSLSPGTYYAFAYAGNVSATYVDELYPDIPCASPPRASGNYCRVDSGAPLNVTAGVVIPGIDFDLAIGGTVAGTVLIPGANTPAVQVQLHVDTGLGASESVAFGFTNNGGVGTYSIPRLPPGNYYVWTAGLTAGFGAGYVAELYNDLPCPRSTQGIPASGPGCSLANATPLSVSSGGVANADFVLSPGGAISGRLLGAGSPQPQLVATATSGATAAGTANASSVTGAYLLAGLPAGQYTVDASGVGYVPQPGTATVDVVVGAIASAPDIDLQVAAPVIRTSPQTRPVMSGQSVVLSVTAVGASPFTYQWYSGASGDTSAPVSGATSRDFTTPAIAAPAAYWVRVMNAFGQADSQAASLTVATTGTGAISGVVTSGGLPVANAVVSILSSSELGSGTPATTSASGAFSVSGLAPGTYYAYAGAQAVSGNVTPGSLVAPVPSEFPYADVLYPNIACAGGPINSGSYCRTNTGSPITVTADAVTQGVNFDLPPAGVISGVVTVSGALPQSVFGTEVALIVDSPGPAKVAAIGHFDPVGNIVLGRLPAGQYRVTAFVGGQTREVWDDVPCPSSGCLASGGTPISVGAGLTTTGIDFDLGPAAPSIVLQPRSQIIDAGQSATLSVQVSGQPQFAYQWYLGPSGDTSSPIPGATSSTYDTGPVTANTAYWVRVSNGVGTVDSAAATVAVNPGAYGGLVGGSGGGVTTGSGTIGPGAHKRGGQAPRGGGVSPGPSSSPTSPAAAGSSSPRPRRPGSRR
ncbi:MAG: carboxypeptidase regulatory-like domain-containing protein [Vicinamibacterales bacterium]